MKEEKVAEVLDRMEAMRLTLIEERVYCDAYRDRVAQLERENAELMAQLEAKK